MSISNYHNLKRTFQFEEMPNPTNLSEGSSQIQSIAENTLNRQTVNLPDFAAKSGRMWSCIGSEKGIHGGKIYSFEFLEQFKDENAFMEKIKEIFPEVEAGDEWACGLDPDYLERKLELLKTNPEKSGYQKLEAKYILEGLPTRISLCKKFNILGFRAYVQDDKTVLQLPDTLALLANWEQLRQTTPNLSELSIISMEEAATDEEFIDAFLKFDLLISEEKSFLHDLQIHTYDFLRGRLCDDKGMLIQQRNDFRVEVSKQLNLIKKASQRISKQDLESIMTALAFKIDAIWGKNFLLNPNIPGFLYTLGPYQLKYIENHYPDFDLTRIQNLWNDIGAI